MPFKFVMLPPAAKRNYAWAQRLSAAVPQVEVLVCTDRNAAMDALRQGARGAYGRLDAELLDAATGLAWLACPAAGPDPGFYFPQLVASPVVVTNTRGIYNDHIAAHIMAFVLAFARGFHRLLPAQFEHRWSQEPADRATLHLPETTALIVGTGGIGGETARHCRHFGMHVIGIDPRCPTPPEGVDELYRPGELDDQLPRAHIVIVTAPQTPSTEGLFDATRLARMRPGAILINIGRGTTVDLDGLAAALQAGALGGAALDVFSEEPLPAGHPLWTAPNFLMTPHCAGAGPYLDERRLELLIDNCQRLERGQELRNVVDKTTWF